MEITVTADSISIISLFVTVILGIWALLQARGYNNESQRTNDDTKFMLIQQIYLMNELQKSFNISIHESYSKICLAKDKIYLHKLNSYQKKNCKSIMREIHKLSIKERFMDDIEKFLLNDEKDHAFNFRGKAGFKENNNIDFMELYSILLRYDILIIIQNKTW